jgi:hypothetical protein
VVRSFGHHTLEPDRPDEPTGPTGVPRIAATSSASSAISTAHLDVVPVDLHRFENARNNADAIPAQMEAGTKPCDEPLPPERVTLVRQWIDDGRPP